MKSDEFSGKMLDDHIEVFCYCNFDYYRNLFWCFCISIYEKEKGSCSGQYCLYWNYVCAVSDTAADWQFSAYMLGVVAAFLVMYVQDRRNIYQKIFLAVTFFSIRWLAVAMAGRMDDFITKALVFGNTIAGRQWLQYVLYAGTRILDIVLCIVFLAVAIGLINKAYVYKNDEMSVKELVMLIIPSLVGVTGYGILQYYLNIYEKDTGKSLTDTYGFYGALSFVHYFISIIAILVMTTMFQNWKVAQEEQTGQELVLNQVSDMKKHIGEVEKLYQDIRSLRHDMGNHIQMLEHLVAENHMDDAAEYMEHLKRSGMKYLLRLKRGVLSLM